MSSKRKVKCIAFNTDGSKCKNDAEEDTKLDWPYNVLCSTHATILESDDKSKDFPYGYGKFKTKYKASEKGEELYLCKGNQTRNTISGRVFFCTKEEAADHTTARYKNDYCGNEYNDALGDLSKSIGGISSPSPKLPPGTPHSPPRSSLLNRSILSSVSNVDDKDAIAKMNQGLCEVKNNKGVPVGIINNSANKKLKKKYDDTGSVSGSDDESASGSSDESESDEDDEGKVGRRRYLPPKYAKSDININNKLPDFFKNDDNIKSCERELEIIDTTRNVTLALRTLKSIMNKIEGNKEEFVSPEKYTVTQRIVNEAAKKLGKYMYDERRIEMVVTFLFDFEDRDLFNPLRYYGFTMKDASIVAPKIDFLKDETTPYRLIDATQIDRDIARPRPISPIFKDNIERIRKYATPEQQTRNPPGGTGPADGGGQNICTANINEPKQGSVLKSLILKLNTGLTPADLKDLDGKKYTKESIMDFQQAFCTDNNFGKYSGLLLVDTTAPTTPNDPRSQRNATGTPGAGVSPFVTFKNTFDPLLKTKKFKFKNKKNDVVDANIDWFGLSFKGRSPTPDSITKIREYLNSLPDDITLNDNVPSGSGTYIDAIKKLLKF